MFLKKTCFPFVGYLKAKYEYIALKLTSFLNSEKFIIPLISDANINLSLNLE